MSTPSKNIIGVFDSGLGGLTVLKNFIKLLPNYNYIYLGDNARVPYGNKSKELIYQYTTEAIDFLFAQGANLIIIACNTASAEALRKIQQTYLPKKYPNKNVLGVIRPLAEHFATQNFKKIGIIGTKSTIGSNVYQTEINKLNPQIKVRQIATPLLVPLVEEGWAKRPETHQIIKHYLEKFKKFQPKALILGCTHYPFLLPAIRQVMGAKCFLPHPGQIVAHSLKDYLKRHPQFKLQPVINPHYQFYTTDDPKKFKTLGEKFLGQKIIHIQKVTL